MKLAWATDLHLDHLRHYPERLWSFYAALAQIDVDGFILTGDIANAGCLCKHLKEMAGAVKRPIYFVLGNHDYYGGSVDQVRGDVRDLCAAHEHLIYLPDEGPVTISDDACLIGVDGWGDGGNGDRDDFAPLNDYELIGDYTPFYRPTGENERDVLLKEMGKRGAIEAAIAAEQLKLAIGTFKRILFATHVPPFIEATWYEGAHSEPRYLVGFSCRAVGDLLIAKLRNEDVEMLVICGHSHGAGESKILPNLKAITGGARYGQPQVQQVLEYV